MLPYPLRSRWGLRGQATPGRRPAPRELPLSLRYGIPLVVGVTLVGLLWAPVRSWVASFFPRSIRLVVTDMEDRIIPSACLEFFAYDPSTSGPSPALPTGEATIAAEGEAKLIETNLGRVAFVRVSAAGFGADYCVARFGEADPTVKLAPPQIIRGTVRSDAGVPLHGARILALGGDRRGVLLEETRSGPDGTFALTGISSSVRTMVVRALLPGFAIDERDHWVGLPENSPAANRLLDFVLAPVPPVKGRIEFLESLPTPLAVAALQVRVHQLPGLDTPIESPGTFTLHGLPALYEARLLLAGLPQGLTHDPVKVRAGIGNVVVRVRRAMKLSGSVVSSINGAGIEGAQVSHDYGARGGRMVRTDAAGQFGIVDVPVTDAVILHIYVPPDPKQGRPESRCDRRIPGHEVAGGTVRLAVH